MTAVMTFSCADTGDRNRFMNKLVRSLSPSEHEMNPGRSRSSTLRIRQRKKMRIHTESITKSSTTRQEYFQPPAQPRHTTGKKKTPTNRPATLSSRHLTVPPTPFKTIASNSRKQHLRVTSRPKSGSFGASHLRKIPL
jgi:hypothetical protein